MWKNGYYVPESTDIWWVDLSTPPWAFRLPEEGLNLPGIIGTEAGQVVVWLWLRIAHELGENRWPGLERMAIVNRAKSEQVRESGDNLTIPEALDETNWRGIVVGGLAVAATHRYLRIVGPTMHYLPTERLLGALQRYLQPS